MCYKILEDKNILSSGDASIAIDKIESIKIRPSLIGYLLYTFTFLSAAVLIFLFTRFKEFDVDLVGIVGFVFLLFYALSTVFWVAVINNGAVKIYCNKSKLRYVLKPRLEEFILLHKKDKMTIGDS